MLAVTCVFVCLLYLTGLRADRSAGVLARPGTATGRVVDSVSGPPSVSGPASTYRGLTAAQWAARFRHRTRQLQQARRALHKATMYPVYGMDPLERAFMCIHGFEGSWTDDGAPHWGGLQMDMGFQATYAPWALKAFGTANHWPISVQLATAIRAKVSGRGFYPWPNTARMCGLL